MAVDRRYRKRVAETEAVELEGVHVPARVVELVGEHEHRTMGQPDDLGELLVPRRDPRPGIDHEEHEIGFGDRLFGLGRDLRAERPRIGAIDAARVDEPEARAGPVGDELLAVARDSRRLVDDCGPRLGESVEQCRLADVREPDDGDGSRDPLVRSLGHVRQAGSHLAGGRARGSR